MSAAPTPTRSDIRRRLGLRPIINVSGTMTALGASICVPEAVKAAGEILPEWVEINDLHRKASAAIAKATGAEAGFVTASAAAGLTLTVAGCMTGADLARVEQLPDATGMRDRVLIQMGHMTGYGANVEQAIRLAGATVVPVGNVTDARTYQLAAKIDDRAAAAMYVVSHHTVQYGQIPLEEFAAECRARQVPVIADLASEYDLRGFLAAGADLAIYSAHKFLGGLTAGIVAGRKDLVRATFLQNQGIGRGMKVGKESIVATIAALEAWGRRDHAAVRRRERAALDLWMERFAGLPGVQAIIEPDPTQNPLDRLTLRVDPETARITAWDLADMLAAGDPPVIVRDHEVEQGWFQLDPCNLHAGEEAVVADAVVAALDTARRRNEVSGRSAIARRTARFERLLQWPD
jgi:L-seryl-tRNA(Ser) seleniumtransferase